MEKEKRNISQRKAANGRALLEKKDYLLIAIKSLGLSGIIAWVFYDSVYGLVLLPLVAGYIFKTTADSRIKNRNAKFDGEFKELLVALSDALSSGYSIENAFKDAEESLGLLFGSKGMIIADVREMNSKISMRIPAEQAFNEFAQKHPTEECLGFAGVFSFARRLGGEYIKNLRRTVEKMEDKLELKQDIRAGIAEKQMEFKVMSVMPIGILAYVKLSSGDFLNSLYRNPMGIVVMTVCIGLYVGAIALGRRIVDIKV